MNYIGLFVLVFASSLQAFEKPGPMEDGKTVDVETGALGAKFKQDGLPLKSNTMYDVLMRYPESKDEAYSAKLWMYPGMGLGAAGGFLMGYTAVQPLFGGDFNAPLFFVGIGSTALAIVCGKISGNKLIRAVDAYNGVLSKTGLQWQWQWQPAGRGLALSVQFREGR